MSTDPLASPSRLQGERLRERFFALRAGGSMDAEQELRAEVEATHAQPVAQVGGLSISFFPTARFKQLRFIEAAEIHEELRPLFARPSAELPGLAAAFVDPEELSFRSFENIIDLDPHFRISNRVRLAFEPPTKLAEGVYRSAVDVSAQTRRKFRGLDELDIYAPPLNPRSRGGKRFIFHSPGLGERLTRALREALPASMLAGLSHVNPVFRCNRFDPGDARFTAHIDSPYADRSRGHISRYSLLLYLTGGRGEAVLRFGEALELDSLDAMTAIIFAQELEHDGGPYVDGPKVFLRTELIYEEAELVDSPRIARTFARACYLSTNSVFDPELERYADAAYNQAAAARWRASQAHAQPEPVLRKHFRGVDFIANGYDYWFRRGALSLPECATIALFDVVNAMIGGQAFHKLCSVETLVREGDEGDEDSPAWIASQLGAREAAREPVFAGIHKPGLFPELEQPDARDDCCVYGVMSEHQLDDFPDAWDPRRNAGMIAYLTKQRAAVEPLVIGAPILIMGQEVFLDPQRFVVEADKIHILSNESLAPVHFAGMYNYDESSFTRVAFAFDAPALLVPPIAFRETSDMVHLMFDLFRNGWMVRYAPRELEVRRLIGPDEEPSNL